MKRTPIIVTIALLGAGTATWLLLRSGSNTRQNYQTAVVTRGNLQATVTSTGTITAVGTVNVGTQVSGTVELVAADYNDHVRRGQLLARLDTRVLQTAVDDAHTTVDRAKAQYAAALDQYTRNKPLYDKKYISAIEFNQYQSNLEAARATVASANITLQRARTNLGYADIRAPADGTVIQRSVEPGQTVAASLSTPTLFTIAHDLSNMQIEASVDESDIGQIRNGQKVRFTVQSHADRTFTGVVRQIRLQPQTVQNVVNYTVVIDASNESGLLLPGMTATVNFEISSVTNVLVVPNGALRFQPPADVLEEYRARTGEGGDTSGAGGRARGGRTGAGGGAGGGAGAGGGTGGRQRDTGAAATGAAGRPTRSHVWTMDSTGALHMITVRVGLSDGQRTEISGAGIREGMTVITGIVTPAATKTGGGLPFGTSPTGRPANTRTTGRP